MVINNITINTTNAYSPLCKIGAVNETDKSPWNTNDKLHKHPYTAIYNLLFAPYQNKFFVFVELGIEWNASMRMWNEYFTQGIIYGFEYDKNKIKLALKDKLDKVKYKLMDVTSKESIAKGFKSLKYPPEIVIDDSTHVFDDQIKIIKTSLPYIAHGGMLIIEDIFRNDQESRYSKALDEIADQISYATFITAEHELEYTPGWNNSKLLVIYKK